MASFGESSPETLIYITSCWATANTLQLIAQTSTFPFFPQSGWNNNLKTKLRSKCVETPCLGCLFQTLVVFWQGVKSHLDFWSVAVVPLCCLQERFVFTPSVECMVSFQAENFVFPCKKTLNSLKISILFGISYLNVGIKNWLSDFFNVILLLIL